MKSETEGTEEFLRLQAVEALACAVAHDLNNAVLNILSYTNFALEEAGSAAQLREDLLEVRSAAEKCENLSERLVALSRRRDLKSRAFEAGSVLRGMGGTLQRVLGGRVELRIGIGEGIFYSDGGRRHFEAILINLAFEALTRMPEGGELEFRLRLDEEGRAALDCIFRSASSAMSTKAVRTDAWGVERSRELSSLLGWEFSDGIESEGRALIRFEVGIGNMDPGSE